MAGGVAATLAFVAGSTLQQEEKSSQNLTCLLAPGRDCHSCRWQHLTRCNCQGTWLQLHRNAYARYLIFVTIPMALGGKSPNRNAKPSSTTLSTSQSSSNADTSLHEALKATCKSAVYTINLKRSAEKELDSIPAKDRARIITALQDFKDNPRPPDGGNYRILYVIFERKKAEGDTTASHGSRRNASRNSKARS